jgi:hypothetical protein
MLIYNQPEPTSLILTVSGQLFYLDRCI